MPGSTPATSQLDWLISMTAMIVLFWSRATRDLLKSFSWGIAALHRFMQRRSCHLLAARPIGSAGPPPAETAGGFRGRARYRGLSSRFVSAPFCELGPAGTDQAIGVFGGHLAESIFSDGDASA